MKLELPDKLSSIDILALTILGEARGEMVEGQIAVGCVIRNRLHTHPSKYKTYKDVCLESKQFSCWNENDPNRKFLLNIGESMLNEEINDPLIRQAIWIARGITDWYIIDNTKGSEFYMTRKLFDTSRPVWARNSRNELDFGRHVFFNI